MFANWSAGVFVCVSAVGIYCSVQISISEYIVRIMYVECTSYSYALLSPILDNNGSTTTNTTTTSDNSYCPFIGKI